MEGETTPRRVLGSLIQGFGDPLVVAPSDMHTTLQAGILGALVRLGKGASLDSVVNDLAGVQPDELVRAEWKACYFNELAYTDDEFSALVARLHREKAAARLRDRARQVVERIADGETPEQVAPLVAAMVEDTRPEVGDEIEEIGDNVAALFSPDDSRAVPLGLACMQPLRITPGSLCVLAARPGGGKTALLGTVALAAARGGWRVLFLSLEMPSKQIRQRLLSAMSGIPLAHVVAPQGTELVAPVRALAELPIGIRDAVAGETLTVERIASLVRAYSKRFPEDKIAVFVDYIQLVRSRDKHERRHELLGHVCRELKAIALREQVPVIAAAQVGRSAEQRGKDAKPQLSDLRESGEIENTADQVVLVHRELASDSAQLAVAKYRMGAPFWTEARFIGDLCLFADPLPDYPERRDWTG